MLTTYIEGYSLPYTGIPFALSMTSSLVLSALKNLIIFKVTTNLCVLSICNSSQVNGFFFFKDYSFVCLFGKEIELA